jgi:poly(3-hydroxyoctanoate) depolymerase
MSLKKSRARTDDSVGDLELPAPQGRSILVKRLKIGGQDLRVGIWSAASKRPPLLLFNGIGVGFEMLAPFAEAIPDIETIAFDVPGAGESSAPALPYRLWMMAGLVSRMLDELGYDQVDVLGVSWGGALAQQYAVQNPKRCRRLILAATVPSPMIPARPSVLWKFLTPRRLNDPEYRHEVAGDIYGGAARTEPELMRRIAPLYGSASRRGYLYQQLALLGWVSMAWLPLLPQHTLILAGHDDPIAPHINARMLRLMIRRSRLHTFDDGHLFLVSQAEGAGRVVDAFLRE